MTAPMTEGRTALVGGLLVAAGPLSLSLCAPALPAMTIDLGETQAFGQIAMAVYFTAFALGQLLCGPLSDGFGRRPVAAGFFAVYTFGSLIAAFAAGASWLLAGRIMQGLGVAAGIAISRAIVRDQFAGAASLRALNRVNLVQTIAPLLAPSAGSLLLGLGDWHLVFAAMALYGLVTLLLVGFALRETLPPPARVAPRPAAILSRYGWLLASPVFIRPAILLGLSLGGFYAIAVLLPFVLIGDLGLSPFQYALCALIQTGAFLVGAFATAGVLRRGGTGLVRIGLLAIGVGGVLFALGPILHPFLVLGVMAPVALWAFGIAFVAPAATQAAMADFGSMAGSAGAMLGFFQIAGGALAALAAGAAFDGGRAALAVLLPLMALAAILVARPPTGAAQEG